MLYNINQKSGGLLREIQKYGCLFMCFAYSSPVAFEGAEGIEKLNGIWEEAVEKGIISGDLNLDGDFDDVGEGEVQNHTALAKLFGLEVHFDGKHHSPDEYFDKEVAVLFGCFKWKSTHFVVLNRRLEVIYDPLGYSNTVKNGILKSTRWYYAD